VNLNTDFSFCHQPPNLFGAHPVPHSVGIGVSYRGLKLLKHEDDHLPLYSTEVKRMRGATPTFPNTARRSAFVTTGTTYSLSAINEHQQFVRHELKCTLPVLLPSNVLSLAIWRHPQQRFFENKPGPRLLVSFQQNA
jgi:hypothetical protein